MKGHIEKNIQDAILALQEARKLPNFTIPQVFLVEPKSPEFGEYTSNISLQMAGLAKMPALSIAELVETEMKSEDYEVKAVAPGYLNFSLHDQVFVSNTNTILTERSQYGSQKISQPKKINNEFISANPTGPLHIGNGRGGYFGDTLTRLLRKVGHQVRSEYYVNDGGEQVVKLGHSVLKDAEAVYSGEYIDELHKDIASKENSVEKAGQLAAKSILENSIQKTVSEHMGILFDTWTSERALLETGLVEKALANLQAKGHTYQEEGALWLRTTDFGDDKDRVLQKSDGSYTYFASDAGHILGYIEEGIEVILETFGADHHGYTKRFEAVARALGFAGEIHFTLMQLVQLEKDGAPFRMSKRAGNTVTMDDLIERAGKDVARFFFLMYSPDTHMTFDLGLAEERSQKNPVFYIQYAHARMVSILEKASELGLTPKLAKEFQHAKERELVRELYLFPEFLERSAQDYAPHRLTQYALRLADLLHSFYGAVKVLDSEQRTLSEHRLAVVLATKIVLAETLRLLGVQAPEKM